MKKEDKQQLLNLQGKIKFAPNYDYKLLREEKICVNPCIAEQSVSSVFK